MATKIDTVTSRGRLLPRREPYWHRIAAGNFVGFRKLAADSAGTWVARAYIEHDRSKPYKALGAFDALPDHQRFDAACSAAREWFDHLGRGGSAQGSTIADVCTRYVKHVQATKGEKAAHDAEARFKSYVLNDPTLAASDVAKLTPLVIDRWRTALRERPTTSGGNRGKVRTASTLNRDMTCFRAALNLALDDGLTTSDFAWRTKLRPIKDADRRRELYLDRAQRKKLIKNAPADLAQFLTGLCLLPLRPGALAALTGAHFDKRLGVVKIADDKAGQGRGIKLPEATIKVFAAAAANKLPAAPLFARADGQAWNKDAWKGPVKAAVEAAKLPASATAYTLRHSVITDLVHGGLDLLTAAQVAGTSVRMIEKHYGHLRDTVAADALSRLAL